MNLPSTLDSAALVFTLAFAAGGLILLLGAIGAADAWRARRRDSRFVAQVRRLDSALAPFAFRPGSAFDAQVLRGPVLLRSGGETAHQRLAIAEAIETALDPVLVRRLGVQPMRVAHLTSEIQNPLRIEIPAGPGRIRAAYPNGRVALFPSLS